MSAVLHGEDDRLVVIVGPCSIHHPEAAMEYRYLLRIFSCSRRQLHDVAVVCCDKQDYTIAFTLCWYAPRYILVDTASRQKYAFRLSTLAIPLCIFMST